jgi:hypothetical protein
MTEALTAKEREDVEDLPGRQEGCPDPTCGVCRANAARGEALAKLLRIHDDQAAALAAPRLEDVVEIQTLKARAQELELVISKLVPLIDPMPDDLRAVLVAAKVIEAEGGNAP